MNDGHHDGFRLDEHSASDNVPMYMCIYTYVFYNLLVFNKNKFFKIFTLDKSYGSYICVCDI